MDLFDVAAKLTIDSSGYESGIASAIASSGHMSEALVMLQTEYNQAAAETKVLQKALNEYTAETGSAGGAGEELAAMLAEQQIRAADAKEQIQELKNAQSEAATSSDELGASADEASAGIEDTGKSAESTAEKVLKAARNTDTFISILTKAASVAKSGFAVVGNAVMNATKAIGSLVNETADYGDHVDKMSQKMGISAKAYQEWDAVLQHEGTSIDTLRTSMRTLANAVENGNDAFARIGITQEQIANMNQEELFSATITGLQNVEDVTERTYLAGQLLGRGATELGPLLNKTAEETEEMKQRVHELGGVMSDEAVKASADFADNMQDLRTTISGLGRSLSAEFLPGVNDVIAGFTSLIIGEEGAEEKITGGLSNIASKITTVIPRIVDIATSIGNSLISIAPQLVTAGMGLINSLVEALISNSGQIIDAAISIVDTLVKGLGKLGPMVIAGAFKIVSELATGLGQALPVLLPEIVGIVVAMAEALTNPDSLMAVINGALELVKGLAEGIVKALPLLIEAVPVIIQNLVDFIVQAIPQIMEAGTQILLMLVQGILEALPSLLAAIPTIIASIEQGLMKLFPQIILTGAQMMFQLALGIWQAVPGLIQQIPTIINSMVDAFVGNATTFAESGVQFIMQLINGIITAVPILMEQIPQIVKAIGAAIVEAAPQIVQAGEKLVSGLWNGIKGAFSGKKGDADVASGFNFDTVQKQATATSTVVGNAFSNLNFDPSAFNSSIDQMNQNMTGLTSTAVSTSELLASSLGTGAARAEQLENRFATSATTAKDNVVNAFSSMGTEASAAVSSAAQGASADWSGVPKGAQTAAKQTVSAFKNLPNQFRAIWQQIKTIYNEVPSFFTRVFTVAKQNVLAAWNGVPAQFAGIWGQIKLAFNVSEATSWGSDMMQNFINGINSKKNALTTAVQNSAKIVSDNLHHSHPDKGPLKDDYTWMPDMMSMFITGIKQYTPKLHKTAIDAFDFSGMVQYPTENYTFSASSSNGNLKKHTVSVRNSTDAKIDTLISLLRAYLPQMSNQQIVLDDGTLVGAMLPQIDAELGQSYLYKLRGNA